MERRQKEGGKKAEKKKIAEQKRQQRNARDWIDTLEVWQYCHTDAEVVQKEEEIKRVMERGQRRNVGGGRGQGSRRREIGIGGQRLG